MENNEVSKENKCLNVGLLNIRSIRQKYDRVSELINDGLYIFVLTQSWHGSSHDLSLRLAMPPNFSFVDYIRPHDPHHGGLIVYFKSLFKYVKFDLPTVKSFEAIIIKFFIHRLEIILLAIYRPGSVPPSTLFFVELSSVLEHVSTLSPFIILLGDFNIHLEKPGDPHAISLLEVFNLFNIVNRIDKHTHVLGGMLDLIVSSENLVPGSCNIYSPGIYSDHSFISVKLPIIYEPCIRRSRWVRSWKRLNESHFCTLVQDSVIGNPCKDLNVEEAAILIKNELKIIVDKVAPVHLVTSRVVLTAPWFDSECTKHKQACRKLERLFRYNKNDATKKALLLAINLKNSVFSAKKINYWKGVVYANKKCPKLLWKVVNNILCTPTDDSVNMNTGYTADDFKVYFERQN